MSWALTREEEFFRIKAGHSLYPEQHEQGKKSKVGSVLGKKDATRQSPVWPQRILDSIIRAKRSPQQIWGKKNTAALLMTPHQIPVENTYVAKSLFKLVVFSVFFFSFRMLTLQIICFFTPILPFLYMLPCC